MKIKIKYKFLFSMLILVLSFKTIAQSAQEINQLTGGLDTDYLNSLPAEVRADLLKEINNSKSNVEEKNLQKRPSSELLKLETVKNWEKFQKEQFRKENSSERYGINLFSDNAIIIYAN